MYAWNSICIIPHQFTRSARTNSQLFQVVWLKAIDTKEDISIHVGGRRNDYADILYSYANANYEFQVPIFVLVDQKPNQA